LNKYYLQQAARIFSPALYHSGLSGLTRPRYSGIGTLLMFHRVLPERKTPRIYNHLGLEITPERLEDTIRFFRQRKYAFVPLDDLAGNGGARPGNRRFVAFTFDDGYADNFEVAYPILKKHGIPFTLYVTTGLPDGHAFLWWYLLEEILLENPWLEVELDGKPIRLAAGTFREKEIAFNRISSVLSAAGKRALESHRTGLFAKYLEGSSRLTRALSLRWSQVEEMSRDPLVTIGAHTVNHYPLRSLEDAESRFEMAESKRIIESRIGKEVRHFCYPIGSYSAREVAFAAECGYRSATTVNMGNFFEEHFSHPFALPRIMINALTTEKLLTLQVDGLLPFILNRGRRILS
jgi:peptidoglycan/xylan/chitin deacetylase (PgdA/CDA1 family)